MTEEVVEEEHDQNPDDGIDEVPFEEEAGPNENEIAEGDIDLDEVDVEDEPEEEDEGRPKPAKVDEKMLTEKNERAVFANPKRENIVRRRSRAEIVNGVDFDDDDQRESIWEQLEENSAGARPRKYSLKKGDYTETDVLTHDSFGKGYILEIISDNKISVLFEDGVRKLAINRR